MYVLIESAHSFDVIPLAQFLEDNADDEDVQNSISHLEAGTTVVFGGGAAPWIAVTPMWMQTLH